MSPHGSLFSLYICSEAVLRYLIPLLYAFIPALSLLQLLEIQLCRRLLKADMKQTRGL